jgi:HD domain
MEKKADSAHKDKESVRIGAQQMQKIQDYAVTLDWEMAFGGKSKGNRHLFRVRDIAIALSEKEGGCSDIVEAGAWLHDCGLIEGDTDHDKKGRGIAGEFLATLGLDKDTCERVLHCIEVHEGFGNAMTIEAKVVHDADVLDKMGPLGVIRQTWKRANSGSTTEAIAGELEQYLDRRKERLYTETAREAGSRLSHDLGPFFVLLRKQLKDGPF